MSRPSKLICLPYWFESGTPEHSIEKNSISAVVVVITLKFKIQLIRKKNLDFDSPYFQNMTEDSKPYYCGDTHSGIFCNEEYAGFVD